tara:strand:- start:604 stop:1050 length:447 start_codon:yes stop_codon:yes gene_type:complete
MNKYTISKPIWDGGYNERCIGIAEFRLPCIVDISYRDKHDNLVYPDKYMITPKFAHGFDKKKVGGTTELRIIPISKLEKHIEDTKDTDKEGYIKELEELMYIAIDCLDNIILTQANSAKYRKMAKDALKRILRSPHATEIQTRSSSKD